MLDDELDGGVHVIVNIDRRASRVWPVMAMLGETENHDPDPKLPCCCTFNLPAPRLLTNKLTVALEITLLNTTLDDGEGLDE